MNGGISVFVSITMSEETSDDDVSFKIGCGIPYKISGLKNKYKFGIIKAVDKTIMMTTALNSAGIETIDKNTMSATPINALMTVNILSHLITVAEYLVTNEWFNLALLINLHMAKE